MRALLGVNAAVYSLFQIRPCWSLRQVRVEFRQQFRLVGTCKRSVEEALQSLFEEPPPTGFFVAGVDGEEQAAIGFGRFVVAGGVADHQRLARWVFLGIGERLLLAARLLPADGGDETLDTVLAPFGLEGFVGSGRADDHVGGR